MAENDKTRRDFLAQAAALALTAPDPRFRLGGDRTDLPGDGGSDEITANTIAEAEKIHGLTYTAEQRVKMLEPIKSQLASVKAVRATPRPLDLQPAITFDPRLPGVAYPAQPNRLVLSTLAPATLPSREEDIAFATVRHQAHWIRTRQITSRRLTEIYLRRIKRLAPGLFCYITVTEDLALKQADAADRALGAGKYRGPLHGIPYGIKDLFDTAGVLTTWGAAPYKDRVPDRDAALVTMLHNAGAVLLGKQATGALANGATWFGGTCRNPWNPEEPAGGSSTGPGSATAAALCSFSIGTDSLCSILNPADRCGVVGLRATFGRIPTAGVMPLTPSLDRIGPLTRSVEDAAIVLAAINGADPTSATSIDMGFSYDAGLDLRKLKVGYSKKWFEQVGFGPGASVPASPAHHAALKALGDLGVQLVEVELPPAPRAALINNLYVEAAAVFEELTLSGRDELLPDAWPTSWRQIRLMSAVDYLQAERLRRQAMNDMHNIFTKVDALFGPTYGTFDLVLTTNFTGHPGLSLRAGLSSSPTRGLSPVALTPAGEPHTITQNVAFHGRLFEEGKILALGRALEAKLDVMSHRPPTG
ncbi:MAG: amidase [Gemmatimonadota bacterium]